jgi:hypothetical protein
VNKIEEHVLDSLSFKQLSMACIETCVRNVWHLKIKSVTGPLFVIGASTLASVAKSHDFSKTTLMIGKIVQLFLA